MLLLIFNELQANLIQLSLQNLVFSKSSYNTPFNFPFKIWCSLDHHTTHHTTFPAKSRSLGHHTTCSLLMFNELQANLIELSLQNLMFSRSSYNTSFFLLPCCPHDFIGKFNMTEKGKSRYSSYMDYVKDVIVRCGFVPETDTLRIPSTKRVRSLFLFNSCLSQFALYSLLSLCSQFIN